MVRSESKIYYAQLMLAKLTTLGHSVSKMA